MLEPVSVGLKFGFLVVLYLFLLWVAWSALRDLRRGRGGAARAGPRPIPDATGMYRPQTSWSTPIRTDSSRGCSSSAPPDIESGSAYDISGGATLGRGDVEIQARRSVRVLASCPNLATGTCRS